MSYHSYSSQYSPPSSSSSVYSNFGSEHSNIAARYEAAKSFDLEDDLEYCPVLSIDEVRKYYDDVTAKSIFFPASGMRHSPPSQSASPSPPNTYIRPSPPHGQHARLAIGGSQTSAFRPPSRGRGTAAVKIIDPTTREERRRHYY